MKKNGFNLENTHRMCPVKLANLMAVCTFAMAMCIRMGKAKHATAPIPYKKAVQSYLYSFFQYGLNYLRGIAGEVLRWISGTKIRRYNLFFSIGYVDIAKK